MQIVIILYCVGENDKKEIRSHLVQMQLSASILDSRLVELAAATEPAELKVPQ
jgi:hypothetical protein